MYLCDISKCFHKMLNEKDVELDAEFWLSIVRTLPIAQYMPDKAGEYYETDRVTDKNILTKYVLSHHQFDASEVSRIMTEAKARLGGVDVKKL